MASSDSAICMILEDAKDVIASGFLTDEEAITFATQIMDMKQKLGLIQKTYHSLQEIQDVIKNTPAHVTLLQRLFSDTRQISFAYGLFGEDTNFYSTYIKNTIETVNQYLCGNSDFVPSIFEQVEKAKQKVK